MSADNVPCPTCGAPPGEPCTDDDGPLVRTHQDRIAAWRVEGLL